MRGACVLLLPLLLACSARAQTRPLPAPACDNYSYSPGSSSYTPFFTAPARMSGGSFAWLDFTSVDATAAYVWHTADAVAGAPADSALYRATVTVARDTPVILSFTADNAVDVALNGAVVGSYDNWAGLGTATVTLRAGTTTVVLRGTNWGGPAGLIFSMREARVGGAVLLNTGSAALSRWSVSRCNYAPPPPAAPAPPPPPPPINCAALAPANYPSFAPFFTAPARMSGGWCASLPACALASCFSARTPGACSNTHTSCDSLTLTHGPATPHPHAQVLVV